MGAEGITGHPVGTGATALSCCRRADLGWIFRKKFFNPRKNQSMLLWISHKLRFSDLLQLWFVWCWVGFCTYSSKHHPQSIYPELFSVGHWILLTIYCSCTDQINYPNTFWAPWTTSECPLPTASSGLLAPGLALLRVSTTSTHRDKEMH